MSCTKLSITIIKKGCTAALLILLASCASAPSAKHFLHHTSDETLADSALIQINANPDQPVLFMGQLADGADSAAETSMLYPGNNAGVFLAAVLTHAAVNKSAQNSKEARRQREADQVLAPFQQQISSLDHQTLVKNSLSKLPSDWHEKVTIKGTAASVQDETWIVESAPTFYLSADKRMLKLQHALIARSSTKPDDIAYQNIIEVISAAPEIDNTDLDGYWQESATLTAISSSLYAHSLQLARQDMAGLLNTDSTPEKTYSYHFGARKMYKRARAALSDCKDATIRTLRGWLVSSPELSSSPCAQDS